MPQRLTVMEAKGDPDRLLEAKREHIDPVVSAKAQEYGALVHVTARTPDGLLIINVWESHEASDRAFQDPEIQAARARMGEAIGGEAPTGTHYDILDFRNAAGA